MADNAPHPSPLIPPRRKPNRGWYLLALALLLGSLGVFVYAIASKAALLQERIDPMPRFVAPTPEAGTVITIDQPGKQNIFYENRGTLDGRAFDTPRRQVWTTYESPAMTCTVTRVETGEAVEVRLPGRDDAQSKSKTSKDQILTYDVGDRQGHSAWVFDAPTPGDYRVELAYVDAVMKQPGEITIPPELSKARKRRMTQADGEAYEAERRAAIERAALAEVEPVDVLFAVGPDPTRGSYFQVIGLRGAAGVLAFGFTFSVLIALVVFMLRNGHVTPRGQLSAVKRGL